MNDFQEQAKNWLRNVVKQNPDKIKAGVEKAGDLIDKQTGGKYAEKVDAVQQKVGTYVDSHNSEGEQAPGGEQNSGGEQAAGDGPTEAADQAGSSTATDGGARVVGGETPDAGPESSAGSGTEGTATGQAETTTTEGSSESDGGLPGPRR